MKSRTYLMFVPATMAEGHGPRSPKVTDALKTLFKAELHDDRQWPVIKIMIPNEFEVAFEVWLMCCGKTPQEIREMRIGG